MKRQIKSATGPYGNDVSIEYNKALELKKHLQAAFDILEEMDDETFNACDGEALIDDLDVAIHEVESTLKFARGLE